MRMINNQLTILGSLFSHCPHLLLSLLMILLPLVVDFIAINAYVPGLGSSFFGKTIL